MTTVNRTAEALEAPQYFTPILRANMAALMQAGGTRAQIARQIALTFVDCENIAEFTAPHCPSPRHAAAWIESLVEHAKTLRHLAAHLEEEEARASVADQIAYETDKEYDQRRREEWQGNAGPSEEAEAMQDAHAAALQGDRKPFNFAEWDKSIRPANERQPASPRPSSVDALDKLTGKYHGSREVRDAGAEILVAAAAHLWNRSKDKDAYTYGDALAIDCMDGLRGMDWGDLKESSTYQQPATFAPARVLFELMQPQPRPSLYNRHPEPGNILSSVALVKYLDTKDAAAAGAEILKNASDYLYKRQNGATWEHADPGDAAAVDALDDYRDVLANGNDLARITDEAGNVDLCEIEPAPSTRVVRILERLTTAS